jgi:signal transduction histidine kinase
MAQPKTPRWQKDALGALLLFVAYFVTARLGLLMDAVAGFATLVWPPTGIALAALLLFGTRLWPGVLAGAVCVNLVAGASLAEALAIGTGNTLEALTGSWLLRRVARFDPRLDRIHDVISLVLLGAICSTGVSAAVGVASLFVGGTIAPALSWPTFRAWWFGDMLGDLVIAPLLLVWISRPRLARRRFMAAEALVLAASLGGCSLLVFGGAQEGGGLLRQPYLIFPPLLWAALRFAQYGTVSGTLLVSAIAIAGTAMGLGPFVRGTLAESLLHLQIFLGAAAVMALTVAAAIAERSRAVDARDEFLAMASHELRTPLTALLVHIQAELRSLRRSGPVRERDEALRQVESTQRMALRLAKLIGELLEVSRIVWGRFQTEREDVDLAALVQDSLVRQEEQLQNARCPVHLEVEGAVRGHWDRGRLDQVVDNLIGNAAKYGAGKPIEVRLQGRAEDVLLEVRDHGIGIAPADHARVFERFERAVSRKQFGGFGLGLWISRKIVEAHGGSISLMSEPGAGCTFSVELPRSASTS